MERWGWGVSDWEIIHIVNINGEDGYLVEYIEGRHSVTWKNNETVFTVDGDLSVEEIIKIAEKIKKFN